MNAPSMVTATRLRHLLAYDADSGVFTWRVSRTGRYAKPGATAGHISAEGYVVIGVDGRVYKAHRLAWLYVHGIWPGKDIDHVNGIRSDNRVANLRLASPSENARNSIVSSRNSSGYRGVTFHKGMGKWRAQIRHNGKLVRLGFFERPDEAYAAYLSAAERLHGDFSRAVHVSRGGPCH